MKKIGVVSYNIYGNFTNYGSALQSWALHKAIKKSGQYAPVLIDYCPNIHIDKDILNPIKNMWDQDEEARINCELTLPDIRENYYKFDSFYSNEFIRTVKKYTSQNFNDIVLDEKIDGFVCGSDTIFCIDEFGFDDGYFANYSCMKGKSVAYAASFGDALFSEEDLNVLADRLGNFNAIGLRENKMIDYIEEHMSIPVKRVLDPTLLLKSEEYNQIITQNVLVKEKYLLYYSRRYSENMEKYVEKMAEEKGLKIVEISLRASNAEKGHYMYYKAGVEEFLSLVRHAEYIVTNSFHGLIFAVQFRKPFVVFSREQGDSKISELLQFLGLKGRLLVTGEENIEENIDYDTVHKIIDDARVNSIDYLKKELEEFLS